MNDIEHLLNFSQDLLATVDFSGYFRLMNNAFQRTFRTLQIDPQQATFLDIFTRAEHPTIVKALDVLRRGHPVLDRQNHLKLNEVLVPLRWSAFPSLEQRTIYFVGSFTDLVVGEENRLRFALDVAPVAMLVVEGENARIAMANGLFQEMFQYSESEVVGHGVEELIPEEYRAAHRNKHHEYMEHPTLRPMGTGKVFHGRRKDGEVFPLDIGLNPLKSPWGTRVVCSLVDVTRREKMVSSVAKEARVLREELAQLEKLALMDELTGTLNRRALIKQLHLHLLLAFERKQPLSVAMLDVDYFKQINDRHGHLVGDEVLKTFVEILQAQIRHTDILARYGGDEFVILMPDTTSENAQISLERIRERVSSHPWPMERITTSIGFTTYSPQPDDIPTALLGNEILLEADVALYQAKQGGRNAVKRFVAGEMR